MPESKKQEQPEETPKRRRGRPRKTDADKTKAPAKTMAKRKPKAKPPAPPEKRSKPGRPPLYGENEKPKGCRYCGSLQTCCYGDAMRGAAPNIKHLRYRKCSDCNRKYTSTEFIK